MPVGMWVMRTAESVVLTCWPPAPLERVGVDLQVALVDLDLDVVVDLRIDPDAGEAGVPARVGVEGRDAHQAVHAALGLELAIGVLALDLDGGGLDAGAPRPAVSSTSSTLKPCRSAQRVYMRSSISAQSWLSVPPAPAWTSR